jgi:hypothetical protein
MPIGKIGIVYRFLLRAGKIAGGVTFIFGIFYGAYQYYEAKTEKQIAQTLELFKEFNSPPISTYRENIFQAISKNRQRIFDAAANEDDLKKVIFDVVNTGGIENQIMLFMDFFDGLAFCVSKNICETDTAVDLFGPRAQELYIIFYQYIDVLRQTTAPSTFGLGLETFAKMKKSKI